MIFLLPMMLALVGTGYFVFATDEDKKWKILSASMVLLSLVFQFIPALHVPWLVPVVMQTLVACWMVIYWKMNV